MQSRWTLYGFVPALLLVASPALAGDGSSSSRFGKSAFPACAGVKLIPSEVFQKNPKGWLDQIQACPDRQLQALPSVGFFSAGVGRRPDEDIVQGVSAQAFFEELGPMIEYALDNKKIRLITDRHCLLRDSKWLSSNWTAIQNALAITQDQNSYCAQRLDYYEKQVRPEWLKSRDELASYWAYDSDKKRCRPADDPGPLNSASSGRIEGLQRIAAGSFSPSEAKHANEICLADGRSIESAWPAQAAKLKQNFQKHSKQKYVNILGQEIPDPNAGDQKRVENRLHEITAASAREKYRQRHLADYDLSVAEFPIIAYLSGAPDHAEKPSEKGLVETDTAFAKGVDHLISNIETESKRVRSAVNAGHTTYYPVNLTVPESAMPFPGQNDESGGPLNDENLLSLIHYPSVVNELLKIKPQYCATADSILQYLQAAAKRKKTIEQAIFWASYPAAYFNPMLGLAMYASPLLFDLWEEGKDLNTQQIKHFMSVSEDDAFFDLKDSNLAEMERRHAANLYMVPAIIGASVIPFQSLAGKAVSASQAAGAIHKLAQELGGP